MLRLTTVTSEWLRLDAVHRYFQYDIESNTSTCELCKNKIKGKHTTNLKNHIATKHSNEYQVVEDLNTKIISKNKSSSSDKIAIARIDQLKKLCVRLVTIHGRPLAIIEDEAFQEIINFAATSDVTSKTINIKAIKTKIQEEANAIRKCISSEVQNKMISLKLDSATCLERKFIGVNVQYIINGRIVVRNLGVLEVCDRQTSTFLKNTIEELLTDFRIGVDQIYCICTDNGSNMVKMVKLMGGAYISQYDNCTTEQEEFELMDENEESEEQSTEEEQVNDIFHSVDVDVHNLINNEGTFKVRVMLCAAHTLQLAVKDAINADALYLDRRLNVILSPEQCQKARTLLKQVYMQINSLKERDSLSSNPELVDTELDTVNPMPSTSSTNYPAIEAMLQSKQRMRGNVVKSRSIDLCLHDLCLNARINLEDDILRHWQNMATTSSEVAGIANTVLGAPATQVSVERLFSSLKFVLHPLRSNISPLF
ncbi:unnamed protein product [Diatraea saccharalis]|uniref:BED-type domain-containing protein n=1 Tax=Diatraea saccharalis TaxID=40085 RepID=A0A9N9R9J4_9NEOP|nr:unnamed protein product [Diatraea saccharalis]